MILDDVTANKPELSDGKIVLRPLTVADAHEHLAGEDAEQVRWLSGQPATLDSVRAWIVASDQSWQSGGDRRNFGAFDVPTGHLVGNIEAQFAHQELADDEVNIAYATFSKWRGRGIASRAVRILTDWVMTFDAVQGAVIRIHPDNEASIRVARATGFADLGLIVERDGTPLRRFERRRPRAGHRGAG